MMNGLVTETPAQEYMREYVDYLDHAIDFPQLSQIRQLDISLQGKRNLFEFAISKFFAFLRQILIDVFVK